MSKALKIRAMRVNKEADTIKILFKKISYMLYRYKKLSRVSVTSNICLRLDNLLVRIPMLVSGLLL